MGRTTVLARHAWLWLCLACLAGPLAAVQPDPPAVSRRILDLLATHSSATIHRDLEWASAQGWNAVRLELQQALDPGHWEAEDEDALRAFVESCNRLGLTPFIQLFPEGAPKPTHPPDYGSRREMRLLRGRIRKLIALAPEAEWVLSFRGSLPRLSTLGDGTLDLQSSLPRQLELVRRLKRDLRQTRLWVEPILSTSGSYEGLEPLDHESVVTAWRDLPPSIGVIWAGPQTVNGSITDLDLGDARQLFGPRELILLDRFPDGYAVTAHPLALVLAPLTGREPALARHIDGYLSRPMEPLAASRLSLLTVANFLNHPEQYDPAAAMILALDELCGDSAAARDALRTQILEWGGAPGEHNDGRYPENDERRAAQALRDPARLARWRWTELRYPERMGQLTGLTDVAFRKELLETMSRRLAIARALPAASQLRGRPTEAGQREAARNTLISIRSRLKGRPRALASFDRFLRVAGLDVLSIEP